MSSQFYGWLHLVFYEIYIYFFWKTGISHHPVSCSKCCPPHTEFTPMLVSAQTPSSGLMPYWHFSLSRGQVAFQNWSWFLGHIMKDKVNKATELCPLAGWSSMPLGISPKPCMCKESSLMVLWWFFETDSDSVLYLVAVDQMTLSELCSWIYATVLFCVQWSQQAGFRAEAVNWNLVWVQYSQIPALVSSEILMIYTQTVDLCHRRIQWRKKSHWNKLRWCFVYCCNN